MAKCQATALISSGAQHEVLHGEVRLEAEDDGVRHDDHGHGVLAMATVNEAVDLPPKTSLKGQRMDQKEQKCLKMP